MSDLISLFIDFKMNKTFVNIIRILFVYVACIDCASLSNKRDHFD